MVTNKFDYSLNETQETVKNYQLSNYEKETTINFNEEEKQADIYTCSKALQRRLDKLCLTHPEDVQCYRDDPSWGAKHYYLPKSWVMKINPPRKLSEEERLKRSERGKSLIRNIHGHQHV